MRRNNLWILLLGCVVFISISILIYPRLNTEAQKKENEMDRITSETLKESVIAQMLHDNVKVSNAEWKLKRAYFRGIGGDTSTISFLFEKKLEVRIFITNYENEEKAKSRLELKLSRGIVKNYNEKGDEGLKTFTATDGTFACLLFKKGNFVVSIYCKDEKVAEYFADQVLKAIKGQ